MKKLAGVHRIKRVPPTEKRGRKHTSTLIITVLDNSQKISQGIKSHDVQEEFLRTSGKGGQRRNKVSTAVRLTHKSTGICVLSDGEREQSKNRRKAWALLEEKILQMQYDESEKRNHLNKNEQMTVESYWTWNEYQDQVINPNGIRQSFKKAMRGRIEKILS